MAERDVRSDDSYLKKLNALLPAEVTGLYLFIRSLAQDDRTLDIFLAGFAVVIAGIFYAIGPQLLKIEDKVTRALYSFTFLLWVVSIEIWVIQFWVNWRPTSFILTGFIAIWTFVLPYIFDGLKQRTG
jgi:hypothetical protein